MFPAGKITNQVFYPLISSCEKLPTTFLKTITYLIFTRVELTFRIFIGTAEPVPKNTTSG